MTADPHDARAHFDLGKERAAQGLFDDAIEQFRKAYELWQKDQSHERKRALCSWADALRSQKHYNEAAGKYQEALGIDPAYAEAYNGLGNVLVEQERFDEAIEQYRKADKLWRKDQSKERKRVLWNWANALRLKKDYEKAANKFQEALDFDPEYLDAYNGLGAVLVDQQRFVEAIAQYREADERWLKKEPKDKDRKYTLWDWAEALCWQKRYDEAAEKYKEAEDWDPDDPGTYNYFGLILAEQGLFDRAIEQYRKADEAWLKKEPKDKDRKYTLWDWAEALRSRKLYKQAAEKCQEAVDSDPEDPFTYNRLGLVLVDQERFDDAIAQYRKADERWLKKEPKDKDRKYTLWSWGSTLLQQERFEDAEKKFALAVEIVPQDSRAVLSYGNSLAALGRYRDAIKQFEKASSLDPDDPYPHHGKAYFLFQLGRYEERWQEWRAAQICYETKLKGELRGAVQLAMAVDYADVLGDVFKDYKASERFYQRVLEWRPDNTDACAGLAILYQQWANSDAATPEIHARLNYQVPRAIELLKRQLDKRSDFQTLLSLAGLYIETSDWASARERLALAELFCGESRLKRAEVTVRQGLVCLRSEEHAEALKNFRQALLVKPGDLTLRSNLGTALLKSKQFEAAQEEFAHVLKLAPGNIDALLGAAQVSIELADDGDPDQYQVAEQHLNNAIKHGKNQESGSKHLRDSEAAKIYYMRGYVRTKSFETDASLTLPIALRNALSDFRNCKKLDPNNRKAPAAIEKINKRLRRRVSELWVDVFGPLAIFFAGFAVFLFAQLDFFFQRTAIRNWFGLPAERSVTDPKVYSVLTFGSLLFMVASLSLPKLLKLKVPGIELEKASVDQVSAPSTLGIGRFESLTK
jgi:tetratricopeptide (TPR) repeat protein